MLNEVVTPGNEVDVKTAAKAVGMDCNVMVACCSRKWQHRDFCNFEQANEIQCSNAYL